MRDAAGNEHSTLAARGKWLVLYFYPKDDTPGCTIEACEFRDSETALQAAGAIVWGVSPDDQSSKAAFRDKFSLNFPILSDLDHQVAEAYGVWGEKQMMGKSFMGTHRVTFLINNANIRLTQECSGNSKARDKNCMETCTLREKRR